MELVHQKNTKKTTPIPNLNNVTLTIQCLYTNADTLTNKMPELKALIQDHKPSVIAITEVTPKKIQISSTESRS